MPDISSITAFLTAVKTATDIAKLLKESDISLEKAELRMKLAELINALADAKIEAADVQEAMNAKDAKIRELEKALTVQSNLKFETPSYWVVDGDKRDGPFCQACYDKERKLIRLQGYDSGVFDCKVCNTTYTTREFRQAQEAAVRRHNRDYDPYA